MPIFTSPFPTTHDTIGASTLDSPTHRLPSPTSVARSRQGADDDHEEEEEAAATINENVADGAINPGPSQVSPNALAATDLDQKMSQLSIDWTKFSGGKEQGGHNAPEEDEEPEPEFGGPEDLTMNLDKYLLGDFDLNEQQKRHDQMNDAIEEDDDLPESPSPLPRRHPEGEESEFEPPLDMSTPSHLMWKKNFGTNKEETHLEDILESFPSSPEKSASPSKNNNEEDMGRSRTFTTVLREIEDLHEQRRERDERIQDNQEKLASANEEIEYLRAELQRKSAQLSDANAKVGEEAVLREQIQVLKKKVDENVSPDEHLADQLNLLREQLEDAQEQLKRRDEALVDSENRIRENTTAQEQQLREKDAEIEDLKAQASERELELANLDEELAEAKQEYAVLEQRIGAIETRNAPLEEKNILLEKEVNRVKSELVAQRNSLSIIATDLFIETDGKTYNEVIESLKNQFRNKQQTSQSSSTEATESLRTKLAEAQAEANQSAAARQAAEAEWKRSQETLAESRALITTVESENTRLTTRLHELNSNLSTVREELRTLKEQRIQTEPAVQPISPPRDTSAALLDARRLEIENLKEAHANAVDNLRTSYNDSVSNLRSLLSASEKREADLHSQLGSLRTTMAATHENEVSDLKSQINDLQSTLAVKEETSAEVDRRISRAIDKREREWERRIDVLLKEREKMSKALMVAWGEKEVGKASRSSSSTTHKESSSEKQTDKGTGKQGQGYRYKYVVRS
ncbi:hypothetical protein PISL3812_04330 [Talaromyces islandicus]|uniref:Spindle pole body associated protein SnaD n=1 Tax=Talaromyces islandicus TaxID=28573 RepID=A0A0U1LV88_TALIS|nr:hypothetical protein PISL3812_04330 [Talaromyces islandicus]